MEILWFISRDLMEQALFREEGSGPEEGPREAQTTSLLPDRLGVAGGRRATRGFLMSNWGDNERDPS